MPGTRADPHRFCLFETPLGWMGMAWSEAGIVRLQLPEADRIATHNRLLRHVGEVVECHAEGAAAEAVAAVTGLTQGEPVDLAGLPVDLDGLDAFRTAIYAEARRIGHGETTTYGELAARAGHPGMARETGEAMGRNPVPLIVPCHRVLAANGRLGGFSASGGVETKKRLLALERARPPSPSGQAAFTF